MSSSLYFEASGEAVFVDGTIYLKHKSPKDESLWWMGAETIALMLSNFMDTVRFHNGFCLTLAPETIETIFKERKIPSNICTITEEDDHTLYEFNIRVVVLSTNVEKMLKALGMDLLPGSPGERADFTKERPDEDLEFEEPAEVPNV